MEALHAEIDELEAFIAQLTEQNTELTKVVAKFDAAEARANAAEQKTTQTLLALGKGLQEATQFLTQQQAQITGIGTLASSDFSAVRAEAQLVREQLKGECHNGKIQQ